MEKWILILLVPALLCFYASLLPYDGAGGAEQLYAVCDECYAAAVEKELGETVSWCVGNSRVFLLNDARDAYRLPHTVTVAECRMQGEYTFSGAFVQSIAAGGISVVGAPYVING